jgi:hypothetical protein
MRKSLGDTAMVLIQLLLPVEGATRAGNSPPFSRTRRELSARFTGWTAYLRSPARGSWTAPDGRTEEDDVVVVEIVTDTFDRAWWREYASKLAERFGQERIHVRALRVDMLDEEGT